MYRASGAYDERIVSITGRKQTFYYTMTKVYVFTKGDRSIASSRTRAFAIFDLIGSDYQEVVFFPTASKISAKSFAARVLQGVRICITCLLADRETVFFLQRPIYSKYIFGPLCLALMLRRNKKVISDFDDAIYVHSPHKTKLLVRLSQTVIVGNHQLYDWVQNCAKVPVYLVPTSINYSLYEHCGVATKETSKQLTIGWVGSGAAHVANIELLREPLLSLAKKYNFTFKIIGAEHVERIHDFWLPQQAHFGVEIIDELDWSDPSQVPMQIAQFDIGVMPLLDNEFNRGKSSFKAIEYMAVGVPVVISPVGENNHLVQDGQTGYLAHTHGEWFEKLEKLITDPTHRDAIGKKGQQVAKSNYALASNARKVQGLIDSL